MEFAYQPMLERLEGNKYWGECEEESIEDFN